MRAPRSGFALVASALVALASPTGAAEGSLDSIVAVLRQHAVRPATESALREEAAWLASELSSDELADLLAGKITPAAAIAGLGGRGGHVDAADLRTVTAAFIGDPRSDLLFVPVAPCRIIDTRVPGTALVAGTPQHFVVAGTTGFAAQGGTVGGCGIPAGGTTPDAAAVAVNFIAVGPSGPGNLRAWEFGQPVPEASVVNYTNVPGLNLANAVIVPIEGTSLAAFDLTARADVSSTHLVADVTGFFRKFSNVTAGVAISELTPEMSLSDGTCKEVASCTFTPIRNMKVEIDASMLLAIDHLAGHLDTAVVNIETSTPVTCAANPNSEQLQIGDAWPADLVTTSVPIRRSFFQDSGTSTTYRLTARMTGGPSAGDVIRTARMFCDTTLR